MILKTVKFKHFQAMLAILLLSSAVSVFAGKYNNHSEVLYPTLATTKNNSTAINSTANSFVTLDFSLMAAESWDIKGEQVNMVSHCINGDSITGVEYIDVKIETIGNSFFSEARINFRDSNVGANDINVAIGSNNENVGVAVFNSNGVFDITDSGNVDVVSLADKKFIMEFHETADDQQGEIDARFTSGIFKVWGVNLTSTESCPFVSQSVSGNSDLFVEYRLTSANSSLVGDLISFDIVVTNSGADEAQTVVIENILSSHLQFSQLTCDDGTSVLSPDSIASVVVNNIPPGGVLSCTLSAEVVSSGLITNVVSVTASNDLDTTNNSTSLVIAGANVVVPINNSLALLLLTFGLLIFARKFTNV